MSLESKGLLQAGSASESIKNCGCSDRMICANHAAPKRLHYHTCAVDGARVQLAHMRPVSEQLAEQLLLAFGIKAKAGEFVCNRHREQARVSSRTLGQLTFKKVSSAHIRSIVCTISDLILFVLQQEMPGDNTADNGEDAPVESPSLHVNDQNISIRSVLPRTHSQHSTVSKTQPGVYHEHAASTGSVTRYILHVWRIVTSRER